MQGLIARRFVLFLLCFGFFLVAFCVPYFAQNIPLKINEAGCRLNFTAEQMSATLALENTTGKILPAHIKLALIDQKDRVRYVAEQDEAVKTGVATLLIGFSKVESKDLDISDEKLWWRLRYEITPTPNTAAKLTGFISASQITPDIFDLQVFAPFESLAGTKYQTRVRTAHPLTGNPVSNVNITALAKYEQNEKEHTIKATAKTNQDGYAIITFDLPKDLGEDEHGFDIEFTAQKGSLECKEELDLQLVQNDFYLVTTDKTLYQPGQTLHTRVALFNPQRQARADYEMEAKIEDSEEQVVFRTKIKTSKFGIASFDWPIPDTVKLGGYTIKIGIQTHYRMWGEARVKISRYDLPTFAVKTKPDKSFYLPNENAEVEIKADYLFGQPVTKGTVKIVRESERHWNYKTYKYDIEEGETDRGETDANGKFITKIDLKKLHEDFTANDYHRFEDVHFAAYFTDATTGRTEQRKFDLRLTKEPLHLYLIKENNYAPKELIDAYVNASYADGAPAECEVEIYQELKINEADKEGEKKLLTRVTTNKLGLAKISGLSRIKSDDDHSDLQVVLQARDARGKTGKLETKININDDPTIRVSTDKTLYRAGENINATIKSSVPHTRAVLEILQNGRVINSQIVTLNNGAASVTIPYKPDLKDDVTLVAYANIFDAEDESVKFIYSSRAILFPRDRELKVAVKMPRNEYRPGEEAQAELFVKTADGKPVNSALGAIIVDTAVGERERTDNEFGASRGWNYYRYYYGDTNIAGLSRRSFDTLDLTEPIPADYDLAAEIMLQNSNQNNIRNHHESAYRTNQQQIFSAWFEKQFQSIKRFLESEYSSNASYPRSLAALKFMLHRIDLDPEELRDPWGTPYKIGFETNRALDEMIIRCAGADKQFGTPDDFTALNISRLYFKFIGEAINRAVANYQAQSGDAIRDAATLKSELRSAGFDLDTLRDPWGTPYQIHFIKGYDQFYLVVSSAGQDKIYAPEKYPSDDFELWRAPVSYFAELRYQIDKALAAYEKLTGKFPGDETTFRAALQNAKLDFDKLRDPLGHGFYAVITENSYYTTRAETITYAEFGKKPIDKIEYIPLTQTRLSINIRGLGEDDKEGTSDDFSVTQFTRVTAEQSSQQAKPVQKTQIAKEEKIADTSVSGKGALAPPGVAGSVTGTVTDPAGAVVANTKIIATVQSTDARYETTTSANGVYILRGLPPNTYSIRAEAAGFKSWMMTGIVIQSGKTSSLDITLNVGGASETVNITAEAVVVQTPSAEMSSVVVKQVQSLPLKGRDFLQLAKINPGVAQEEISTPRLREYFPETLLWQPNIETDKNGRAQLKFKLADNITTWKLSLIGSTVDGQLGTAEQDIRAFQPFFAELDPPKILTEGDEISLPVVLRNYLDKSQTVDVQFKPENWFAMLSPARKKSEVKPNDSSKEIFTFRAAASIKDGKQRVTAIGSSASDAIEKSVNVHPDGEELAQTSAGVFSESGTLEINLPNDAIKGSTNAEVNIYPNLLTHVTEGIEGILHRPYGCGEQTISSTYPNVMALRLLKATGQDEDPRTAAIAKKARKFSQAGYERLLGYRDASGGFTYWGKGEPDLALTAYAVRFLHDASDVVEINEDYLDEARAWLLKQQSADGHWIVYDYYDKKESARRSLMYTSLIARALSLGKNLSANDKKAVTKALDYLTPKLQEISEPYALANYVLAANAMGESARAIWAVDVLRKSALDENGGLYWAMETNTAFYGWGLAGRIETTALVIKALGLATERTENTEKKIDGEKAASKPDTSPVPNSSSVPSVSSVVQNNQQISKGVFWLLKNKDRYGVWLSTQATINVLDAFISLNDAAKTNTEHAAEIFVNGKRVSSVTMPPSNQLVNPLVVNLSQFLRAGKNEIEIKRPSNTALASAQAVAAYYVPWSSSLATPAENLKLGAKRALRLGVIFDKTTAKIGEEISCHVEAERIGSYGYGMLLAEIGLPPGVDVDRASLESAAQAAGYAINHYDILPDRVVLYLWPQAGGTKFDFKFKSRYGIKAVNTASILYDYYNPEAHAVIVPEKFIVN